MEPLPTGEDTDPRAGWREDQREEEVGGEGQLPIPHAGNRKKGPLQGDGLQLGENHPS